MPFRSDLLSFWGIEILQVRLRNGSCALAVDDLVDDRNRRFRQDADRRYYDLELARRFGKRQVRFVLPGKQHVAHLPADERHGRPASARVEHRDFAEDVADELPGLRLVSAGLTERVSPRSEIIPASAAGRLRI